MVCGTTTRAPAGSTWKTEVAAAMPDEKTSASEPPSRPATTFSTCSYPGVPWSRRYASPAGARYSLSRA